MNTKVINRKIALLSYFGFCLSIPLSLGVMEMVTTLAGIYAFFLFIFASEFRSRFLEIARNPIVAFCLAFLALCFVSAYLSPMDGRFWHSVGHARALLLIPLLACLWGPVILEKFWNGLSVILAGALLAASHSFYQLFFGIDWVRGVNPSLEPIGSLYRTAGFFGIPLTYAYSIGIVWCLLVPLALTQRIAGSTKLRKIGFYLALLIVFCSILTTSVRGAWLAFSVVILVFLLLARNEKRTRPIVAVVAIVCGVLLLIPEFYQRLFSIFDLSNLSNQGRLNIWSSTIALWREHPYLGVGFSLSDYLVEGMYEKYSLAIPALGKTHHAHNDYLQVLVGTGVFGLFLYLGCLMSALFYSYKGWAESRDDTRYILLGCLLAIVFFMVGGATQCNFTDREVAHSFSFILILVVVYTRELKAKLL